MTVTEKDRDILARTLWGEARGESLAGQIAVAWTIRNRVNDGKDKSWWGEGYAGVCQKPYQFSCWNRNDPNFAYLSGAKQIPFRELARARLDPAHAQRIIGITDAGDQGLIALAACQAYVREVTAKSTSILPQR